MNKNRFYHAAKFNPIKHHKSPFKVTARSKRLVPKNTFFNAVKAERRFKKFL